MVVFAVFAEFYGSEPCGGAEHLCGIYLTRDAADTAVLEAMEKYKNSPDMPDDFPIKEIETERWVYEN